jgi:hypothetical protein
MSWVMIKLRLAARLIHGTSIEHKLNKIGLTY